MPRPIHPRSRAVTSAGALAALLAIAGATAVEGAGAAAAPTLHDLTSLTELGETFDDGAGVPRLVLLLSPT